MIEPAMIAAVAAVAGGVVAVIARDRRTLALGLVVALTAAPLASSPAPGALSLAARFVGALLAADLLLVATRATSVRSGGSAIGLAAEGTAAAAAFIVGLWIAPVKPLPGPVAEQAAALALLVLAAVPLTGRDVLRVGVGTALLALGLSMLRDAWLGPAQPFENLAVAALLVALLGAAGLLAPRASASAAEPEGTLDEVPEAGDEAYPPALQPAFERSVYPDVVLDVGEQPEGDLTPPPLPASYRSRVRQTRNPRGSEPHR